MKLKALLIALSVSLASTSAFAQWFPARINMLVLPGQVSAEVFNPYYEPIICRGEVYGQTIQGPVFNAFFIEQFLPAGGFRYAFVQTTPFAPFIGGWANIYCRFARFY